MPQPQVESGLIQTVSSERTHGLYETDGDGTETKGGDIRKALKDVDSPQAIPASVTAWLTATGYVVHNIRSEAGENYECLEDHTSGTFATDLAAGKWRIAAYGGNKAFGILDVDGGAKG